MRTTLMLLWCSPVDGNRRVSLWIDWLDVYICVCVQLTWAEHVDLYLSERIDVCRTAIHVLCVRHWIDNELCMSNIATSHRTMDGIREYELEQLNNEMDNDCDIYKFHPIRYRTRTKLLSSKFELLLCKLFSWITCDYQSSIEPSQLFGVELLYPAIG